MHYIYTMTYTSRVQLYTHYIRICNYVHIIVCNAISGAIYPPGLRGEYMYGPGFGFEG